MQRIVQFANRRDELTTRNDVSAESGWLLKEVDDSSKSVCDGTYFQLLKEHATTLILLTRWSDAVATEAV
ncbi:hypothetical protein PNQ92_03930 [Halobacterium salinarum]|uniref:hypothetical protein n=1 Tax=Halobacterium salinarum TaxID=2242 RepID=UPI0025562B52|nr:hypothetical protein [Halobacterium salinarum]MDL0124562.1 hypothetical protein [Halobacterium salinarum]MDL0135655.1 hypothetical protein [Halobacterium salinarum]